MKSTTLFEISKILKMSPSTVSRALRDHPDIAPETKAKVLDLAKKLDYVPNLFAVSLRKDKSREIGIIVPNLSGLFYETFISSVEEEAKKSGYSLMILLSGDDPDTERESLRVCKQRRLDAVMLCVTEKTKATDYFTLFQERGMPLVFFDKVPDMDNINTVCVADVRSTEMAVRVLFKKDKSRVLAIFGNLNLSITKRRIKAYKNEVNELAYQNKGHRYMHASNSDEAKEIAFEFLKSCKPDDAIYCMSDEILIGVMKAVQMLSKRIPEDISVISISNGFFPKLYFPEITYVETSAHKLGKLAFKRTLEVIDGDASAKSWVGESILVEGGSI